MDGVQPLPPLAACGCLRPRLGSAAPSKRRCRRAGLEFALRGWLHRARSPARRRGKGGHATQALGRSRGGFSTKIHVRAERGGKPLVFALTGGERNEQFALPLLLESGAVKRVGRGRSRIRPDYVVGDKGYSSRTVRRYLRERGIGAVIPRRRDEPPQASFDCTSYRERNRVERLFNRLKQHRGIATRYDKRGDHYAALLLLASILLWL